MLNRKGERELCYVVKIDNILPIEGADKVELALVGGWSVMVRKGQFRPGSAAVYFEIDSKVPAKEPFMFLAQKHFKIKTQKYFKGKVISQGLLMSFDDFVDPQCGGMPSWLASATLSPLENRDLQKDPIFLTKELGVTYAVDADNERKSNYSKYDKMYQRHQKLFKNHKILRELFKYSFGKKILFIFLGKKKDKRAWPAWVTKTDEERIENLSYMFQNKQPWIATEKIDGTSTTFTIKRKPFGKNEFYVCSRNVVFDAPEKTCYYDTNVYLEMAEKYSIEEVLNKLLEKYPEEKWITIQGETYGAGIQERDYSIDYHDFRGFNLVFSTKGRLNPIKSQKILEPYGIKWVPILNEKYILPDTIEELRNYVNSEPSRLDGIIKEGIVFRSLDGKQSFKCVSPEFLIKYHQ